MFEDTGHFDFDDDAVLGLGTSFTPAYSSSQISPEVQKQKRNIQELIQENSKKLKLSQDEPKSVKGPSPCQNKSIDVTFSSPNRIVKRKFPGPAGILPERMERNKSISELIASENSSNSTDSRDEMVFCSQQTVSTFEDGPWKQMTKDFHVRTGEYLYEKFTISWIKKQASLKKLLVNHKAPFLAAIIHSLEIFDGKVPTVNVTLKDATGDIQGTILYSLYEEYSSFFTLGSVLVLKQFGVLSAGYDNHCLTITPNNLLTIYCLEILKKPPEDGCNGGSAEVGSGSVKKVVIQECIVEDILRKYDKDVLANCEQRQRSVNFGKLNQNYRSLCKNNNSENSYLSSYNKFVLPSTRVPQETHKSVFINSLTKSVSENSKQTIVPNIPLKSFNRVLSDSVNAKKKFYFKESVNVFRDSSGSAASCEAQTRCTDQERSENKNCDSIVISNSQISVKPDTKEHMDIWRNLLQDVDTDSLFEDF